jgi:hypothetical protein
MSQETPKNDPRKQTDKGTFKQTDEPWGESGKGVPVARREGRSRALAENQHELSVAARWAWHDR